MAVSFHLQSLNQRTEIEIETFVIKHVTGNLEIVNWKKHSKMEPFAKN